jgi:hypothetical protein
LPWEVGEFVVDDGWGAAAPVVASEEELGQSYYEDSAGSRRIKRVLGLVTERLPRNRSVQAAR